MTERNYSLEAELEQLFDLRKAKNRDDKMLAQEAMDAQRDIRLLTLMFRDGVPDITIPVNDFEAIKWDSQRKSLLYIENGVTQVLEGSSRQTMVRMRPHLKSLVKQAKDFYRY